MTKPLQKQTIGSAEILNFPEIDVCNVPSRIDTGARTSAIWATEISEEDEVLSFVLFGKGSPLYTGQKISVSQYTQRGVATSTGHIQKRYVVKLLVVIKGRKIRASFTLADRSTQVYPVLIGRNVLRGKFIVDVKLGDSLRAAEKERNNELENYEHNHLI